MGLRSAFALRATMLTWRNLLPGVFLVFGCNPLAITCPAIVAPAILLEVREAGTGFPAAHDARGAVRDGTYLDSLRVVGWEGGIPSPSTELLMGAALDRPGQYAITLEKPGYETWQRSGITVGVGTCGTDQVQIPVLLVPTP